MLLIAGLGNPGSSYAGNRHNVGFMVLDEIAREPGFGSWSRKLQGQVAEGLVGGEKVVLLKPSTFMNLSGQAVGEAVRFYKLEPKDVVVVHDELDLAPGKLRVKTGGGNGGHNGLKSIDAHIGKEYRRVRIGIGHPGSKERVTPHVLSDFAKADRDWLEPLLAAIARNIESLVKGEDALFMNRVHMATDSDEPAGARGSAAGAVARPPAKGQSHIRQARGSAPAGLPAKGPMADMLKRLFGKD